MNTTTVLVSQNLNLDVPRLLDVSFDVHTAILKSRRSLCRSRPQCLAQPLFRANDPHSAAPATCGRLNDNREANIPRHLEPFLLRSDGRGTSRQYRQAGFVHCPTSLNLVAHKPDYSRLWSNELDVARFTNLSKVRRLGKKAITRVDGIDIENLGMAHDFRTIQVTLG